MPARCGTPTYAPAPSHPPSSSKTPRMDGWMDDAGRTPANSTQGPGFSSFLPPHTPQARTEKNKRSSSCVPTGAETALVALRIMQQREPQKHAAARWPRSPPLPRILSPVPFLGNHAREISIILLVAGILPVANRYCKIIFICSPFDHHASANYPRYWLCAV